MKRIAFIASQLKGFQTVLDVGCDHGFVLKAAFDQKYIKKAIASDLRKGPLNAAKKHLEDYPVEFVLSKGFQHINQTFDIAVLTGMGSRTIIDILQDAPQGEDIKYLLGPQDKPYILRKWLSENDFMIVDEFVIYDQYYYVFMMVKRGFMHLTEKDIYIGPILKTKPERSTYYQYQIAQYEQIIKRVNSDEKLEFKKLIGYFKT